MRARPGRLQRTRGLLEAHAADVVAAAISLVLGAFGPIGAVLGPLFRAAVGEAERRRTQDIRDAAIGQIIEASRDLCAAASVTLTETHLGMPLSSSLEAFALALTNDAVTPDWRGKPNGMLRHSLIGQAESRWSGIEADLRAMRDAFVRELGGSYLLPADAARAIHRQRRKLEVAAAGAGACAAAARHIGYIEINGGLDAHNAEALDAFDKGKLEVKFAVDDILDANSVLETAGWREIPDRMSELFPEPRDPAELEAALRRVRLRAMVRVVENARVIPVDAADIDERLARSSSANRHPLRLEDLLADDFDFSDDDTWNRMNGWNAIANASSGAQSRFRNLTTTDSHDIDDAARELRQALLSGLGEMSTGAGTISGIYRMRHDARLKKAAESDITAEVAKGRHAFREGADSVLRTIKDLEDFLSRQARA